MKLYEVNFDALIGPTHHFGGLSFGNIASMKSKHHLSHPKKAALQGLEKMKLLMDLGVKQAVLPPQLRPDMETLYTLGFKTVKESAKKDPALFDALAASSNMWAANAAIVTPSCDAADGFVHFTPANLNTFFHRSLETPFTAKVLRLIFSDRHLFKHHPPVPHFSDEGAANHTRLDDGSHLFFYGDPKAVKKFPARQSRKAFEIIARNHTLKKARFVALNPKAIDAGVFHADVILTSNENFFLYHEKAFQKKERFPCEMHCISEKKLSLKKAVSSYFFNSQIVSLPNGKMAVIAPMESRGLKALFAPFFEEIHFVNVRESMLNGGGPACLRLRVPLTEKEFGCIHQGIILNESLYSALKKWIQNHYREQLYAHEIQNEPFLKEAKEALLELSLILQLKGLYG